MGNDLKTVIGLIGLGDQGLPMAVAVGGNIFPLRHGRSGVSRRGRGVLAPPAHAFGDTRGRNGRFAPPGSEAMRRRAVPQVVAATTLGAGGTRA
jgi:hypothetical protein